jgi:hypothetical protein
LISARCVCVCVCVCVCQARRRCPRDTPAAAVRCSKGGACAGLLWLWLPTASTTLPRPCFVVQGMSAGCAAAARSMLGADLMTVLPKPIACASRMEHCQAARPPMPVAWHSCVCVLLAFAVCRCHWECQSHAAGPCLLSGVGSGRRRACGSAVRPALDVLMPAGQPQQRMLAVLQPSGAARLVAALAGECVQIGLLRPLSCWCAGGAAMPAGHGAAAGVPRVRPPSLCCASVSRHGCMHLCVCVHTNRGRAWHTHHTLGPCLNGGPGHQPPLLRMLRCDTVACTPVRATSPRACPAVACTCVCPAVACTVACTPVRSTSPCVCPAATPGWPHDTPCCMPPSHIHTPETSGSVHTCVAVGCVARWSVLDASASGWRSGACTVCCDREPRIVHHLFRPSFAKVVVLAECSLAV